MIAQLSLLERANSYRAHKSLGQNFLVSQDYLEKIAHAISAKPNENIFEIGPGLGFMTDILLDHGANMTVLDLDNDALGRIFPHPRLHKIHGDALQYDYDGQKYHKIVGNLPFNVGTKILLNFLGEIDDIAWGVQGIEEMVFMFQLEVARRLTAQPGCKAYSPITITAQAKADIEFLFEVPASCFYPVPKVKAAVIRIKPKAHNELEELTAEERKRLRQIIKQAFSQRRKTLRNSLKSTFTEEQLSSRNINPELRAECLSLGEYIYLCKRLFGK